MHLKQSRTALVQSLAHRVVCGAGWCALVLCIDSSQPQQLPRRPRCPRTCCASPARHCCPQRAGRHCSRDFAAVLQQTCSSTSAVVLSAAGLCARRRLTKHRSRPLDGGEADQASWVCSRGQELQCTRADTDDNATDAGLQAKTQPRQHNTQQRVCTCIHFPQICGDRSVMSSIRVASADAGLPSVAG